MVAPARRTTRAPLSISRSAMHSVLADAAVTTPDQHPHTRQQLGEGERLDQIVVGAGVEAPDAIVHAVARRQHQHRRCRPLLRTRARTCQAIELGQHQGRARSRRRGDSLRTRGLPPPSRAEIDRVAGLAEALAQGFRKRQVVLDDQDAQSTPREARTGTKRMPARRRPQSSHRLLMYGGYTGSRHASGLAEAGRHCVDDRMRAGDAGGPRRARCRSRRRAPPLCARRPTSSWPNAASHWREARSRWSPPLRTRR